MIWGNICVLYVYVVYSNIVDDILFVTVFIYSLNIQSQYVLHVYSQFIYFIVTVCVPDVCRESFYILCSQRVFTFDYLDIHFSTMYVDCICMRTVCV